MNRGAPHLQAGQVHVLDDAASAGCHLLLQEEAAELQRGQADLAIWGTVTAVSLLAQLHALPAFPMSS